MAEPRIIDTDGSGDGDTPNRPPRTETPPKAPRGSGRRASASRPASASSPTPPKRSPADRKLGEKIASMYETVGAGVTTIGMVREHAGVVQVGVNLINTSGALGDAWLDLADENPRIKKALHKFTEASTVAVLVGLHVHAAMPLLPFNPMALAAMQGVPTPDPTTNGHAPTNN